MGGIITKDKLSRLRSEIESLRAAKNNIRPSDLVSLARSLGREPAKRGKHPTYVSTLLQRNPISIPSHPGAMKARTAMSILDELEADIDKLSSMLDEQERKNDPKRLPTATIHEDIDS